MSVCATFIHEQGYKHTVNYKTRGMFLQSLSKFKHYRLDNAVDYKHLTVITPRNLEEYKNKR